MNLLSSVHVPNPPKQTIFDGDGTHLSYRQKGSGAPIVFLHGLLGSSKAWTFQFEGFADQFHTAAWDAPGYGDSTQVPVDIDAYAEALAAFLVAFSSEPVTLVGHSMGGTVASRLAAQQPQLVRRLVLSCTHPGYGDPETAPMSEKFQNRMKELKEIGPKAYGERRAQDLLPDADTPPAVRAYAAEVASDTDAEGLTCATRMLQLADNRPFLPKLTMPVLILTGEKDKVVAPRLKEELLSLAPHVKHIEMPGLAHAPYFQSPAYYNSLIRDFIAQY